MVYSLLWDSVRQEVFRMQVCVYAVIVVRLWLTPRQPLVDLSSSDRGLPAERTILLGYVHSKCAVPLPRGVLDSYLMTQVLRVTYQTLLAGRPDGSCRDSRVDAHVCPQPVGWRDYVGRRCLVALPRYVLRFYADRIPY